MFRRTLQCLRPKVANPFPATCSSTPTNNTNQRAASYIPPGQLPGPNAKLIKLAAKSNISFSNALRKIPNDKPGEFPLHFTVSPEHVFSVYHTKYLGMFEHPLTAKILYTYTHEKKLNSLWCYVHGSLSQDSSTVVVRTTSERMVWKALSHALNAAGYDIYGRSLEGTTELRGTIRIAIPLPKTILKCSFDGLVAHLTDTVATQIIPRLRGEMKPSSKARIPFKGPVKPRP